MVHHQFAHLISQDALAIVVFSVIGAVEAVLLFMPCPRCKFGFTSKANQMFDRKCAFCGLSLDRVQD